MKTTRSRNIALLTILGAACILTVIAVASAGQAISPTCCVSGKFRGHRADIASPTCPTPKSDDFTMNISQERGCGTKVWGDVLSDHDADHPAQKWEGTVKASLTSRTCCELKGGFTTLTDKVEWTILLCKRIGKWTAQGTYKSTHGTEVCNGTLTMTQI